MYVTELQKLLDNIQCDSMSRDEVFYDVGRGSFDRKSEFFNLIKELEGYFKFYLLNEERIMNNARLEEDPNPEFSSLCKSINNNIRSKTSL